VVTTENLMAEEHDTLIKLVESAAGQEADDLATAMARTPLPDGRNMLTAFHTTGKNGQGSYQHSRNDSYYTE